MKISKELFDKICRYKSLMSLGEYVEKSGDRSLVQSVEEMLVEIEVWFDEHNIEIELIEEGD
jgi:hypothetical protein